MSDDATLKAFYRIFQGNSLFFVTHQPPFSKDKEGKVKASWCGFAKYGSVSFPEIPEDKEEGNLVPLTKEHYREHLNGDRGIAVSPLCYTKDKKCVCYYAVIDIDAYNVDFMLLIRKMYEAGLRFAPFTTKTNGLHIYFFFKDAEHSEKVIETLNRIVDLFGIKLLYWRDTEKSKVEVFPKQATLVPGFKNANCLFLPFFDSAKNSIKNRLVTVDGKLIGVIKAIPLIEDMFTSLKEIQTTLDNLPYSDAPYCIQAISLTGALVEMSGRNVFLFAAAIYCKNKYEENFYGVLEDINNRLEAPLEDKELKTIYKSVTEKGYDKIPCKKSPCADYCNKKLCKLREFAPGRDKNSQYTGADCWGELTKVLAGGGEQPYYLWQVRVNPDDPFKTVRIDSVEDLQNQAVMQRRCWRDLNWAPCAIPQNKWVKRVNDAMSNIDDRTVAVPKETDTTDAAMMHDTFLRFLTHKQIQKDAPYLIKVGQVYHANKAYFFTTRGFVDFLAVEKRQLGRGNLRETLKDYGCEEGEVKYKNPKGIEIKIPCWMIKETDEILAMDAFYEDIYEGDADIIRKSAEQKEGKKKKEAKGGNDTKF